MRRPILAAVAASAILSLSLAATPALAIDGGWHDDGDHPNVGIMYMDELPALTYGLCTGSLLSEDEFLVAGHCTAALTAYVAGELITKDDVFVSFDETFTVDGEGIISTTTRVGVTGWNTHPSLVYNSGILRNDVGVLHLATPQSQDPIDLPEAGFLDSETPDGGLRGHEFTNVGYGLNAPHKGEVTWDHARMVSETEFVALTSNNLIQVDGTSGGDSGGPHFWAEDSNLVVAVTSCGAGSIDAAQRLDLEPVLDFLEPYLD